MLEISENYLQIAIFNMQFANKNIRKLRITLIVA